MSRRKLSRQSQADDDFGVENQDLNFPPKVSFNIQRKTTTFRNDIGSYDQSVLKQAKRRAVVVAQLAEWSLPIPGIPCLNPVTSEF